MVRPYSVSVPLSNNINEFSFNNVHESETETVPVRYSDVIDIYS